MYQYFTLHYFLIVHWLQKIYDNDYKPIFYASFSVSVHSVLV